MYILYTIIFVYKDQDDICLAVGTPKPIDETFVSRTTAVVLMIGLILIFSSSIVSNRSKKFAYQQIVEFKSVVYFGFAKIKN